MRISHAITILSAALLLSACQPAQAGAPTNLPEPVHAPPTALPATAVPPTEEATQLPIPTDTALPPTATPPPSYKVLSPTQIQAGDYTLDVTVDLFADELHFLVHSEFPVSIEKTYPNGEVPAPAKSVDIQIKGAPNKLKGFGGGGGGGGEEDGMTERSQGSSYFVEPMLNEGDKVHVTALVTFDDTIGIPEPVLFEYDLVVKKKLNLNRIP